MNNAEKAGDFLAVGGGGRDFGVLMAAMIGVAIFQLIRNGETSPATESWLRLSLFLAVPMLILAAIHSEISRGWFGDVNR